MQVERVIRAAMFTLQLRGLCSLSAWIGHAYLIDLILQVVAAALSGGTILLVLRVSFGALRWGWWTESSS